MLQRVFSKATRAAQLASQQTRKTVRFYTAEPQPGTPEYHRWHKNAKFVTGYQEDDSWRFAPEQPVDLKPNPKAAAANAKARVLLDQGKLAEAEELLINHVKADTTAQDHITAGLFTEMWYLRQAETTQDPNWAQKAADDMLPELEKEFKITPATFNEAMKPIVDLKDWPLAKQYVEKAIRDKIYPDWQGVVYMHQYYTAELGSSQKAVETLKELKTNGVLDPISFEKGLKAVESLQ